MATTTPSSSAAAATAVQMAGNHHESMDDTTATTASEIAVGSHLFKVTGYSLTKGLGINRFFQSGTFAVGGCLWAVLFFPDGVHEADKAEYISIYLALLSDVKNVTALYTVSLVDPSGTPPSAEASMVPKLRTFAAKGCDSGFPRFMKRDRFEASPYLKYDCFTIKCTVSVIEGSTPQVTTNACLPEAIPPSDLHQHLGQLLESGEGADVSFDVKGTTFAAHRYVLSARSSAFKAELLNSKIKKSTKSIKIENMEPLVFKSLLHFIYTDMLPEAKEVTGGGTKRASTVMNQRLLAAAGRYAINRLKIICENKLCEEIELDTVATTLAVAQEQNCSRLKSVCVQLATSPENFVRLTMTDGFEDLKRSHPSVVKELLEKVSSPSASKGILDKGREIVIESN